LAVRGKAVGRCALAEVASLVTFYVFFVIELETRRIEIAGIAPGLNEAWMMQIGRNLTAPSTDSWPRRGF
jgi:hypothetical protein